MTTALGMTTRGNSSSLQQAAVASSRRLPACSGLQPAAACSLQPAASSSLPCGV